VTHTWRVLIECKNRLLRDLEKLRCHDFYLDRRYGLLMMGLSGGAGGLATTGTSPGFCFLCLLHGFLWVDMLRKENGRKFAAWHGVYQQFLRGLITIHCTPENQERCFLKIPHHQIFTSSPLAPPAPSDLPQQQLTSHKQKHEDNASSREGAVLNVQ
jgi:hypothetical protein